MYTVYCIYTPSQKRWQRTKLQVPHRWKKNIVCSVLINFFDWGYFVLKENNEKAHCGRASDYRGFEFCITMLLMCSRVIVLCCAISVLHINCMYCCELTGPLLWVGVSPAPWSYRWCCSAVAVQLNKKISFSSDSVYSYCIFITVNTPHKKDNMVAMYR